MASFAVLEKAPPVNSNQTVSYLKHQGVTFTVQQVQSFDEMNLTLTDLRNIDISTSEFSELCQELRLSIGPKLKLKSAIVALQQARQSKGNDDSNKYEAKTDDADLQKLVSMGFTAKQGIFALEANQQDLMRAIETLTAASKASVPSSTSSVNNTDTLPSLSNAVEAESSTTPLVPIGVVIAWHKHFAQTALKLPNDSWMECNGQTIDDPQSMLDGQTLPDLNGEGRFLRGGTASGVMQEDELKKHSHSGYFQIKGGSQEQICWNLGALSRWNTGPVSETGGDETRPKNMSVVWIMRIK